MSLGSIGESESSSYTTDETRLTQVQAAILGGREEQYQKYVLPEFQNLIAYYKTGAGSNLSPYAQGQVESTNKAYATAKNTLAQAAAQRGLTGSGTELAAVASTQQARSSALADAYRQARDTQQTKLTEAVTNLASMAPATTTAVTSKSEQESSSKEGSEAISYSTL